MHCKNRRTLTSLLLIVGAMSCALLARRLSADSPKGAELPAAPPLAEAGASDAAGLTLTIESAAKDKAGIADVRAARVLSLRVPEGTPPSAFLAAGAFKATWTGDLLLPLRSEFAFSALGRGALKMTINGNIVLECKGEDFSAVKGEMVRLNKGKNHFACEYTSPDAGDAWVRVFWSASDFAPEPVSPTMFNHDENAKPLAAGERVRQGRMLTATLRCTKCHNADDLVAGSKAAMPELAMDAPSLADVGGRLTVEWMAHWISNPRAIRSNAAMPQLSHGDVPEGEALPDARDIAAYLATVGAGAEVKEEDAADDVATAGGKLFATFGCIGCHTTPDKEPAADDPGRVSLAYVKAKYKPAALREFLQDPAKRYAWIRMPNFRFNEAEAKKLAAFLLATSAKSFDAGPAGNAEHGKQLVQSSGCLNCHTISNDVKTQLQPAAFSAIPKDGWARGCVGKDDAARGKAPDFGLDDAKRDALVAFAATDRASLRQDCPPEFAERQIALLRCTACHSRDNQSDLWDDLKAETQDLDSGADADIEGDAKSTIEGEAPPGSGDQTRPTLTWTGEKLKPEWMAQFISGKLTYKPRVWLRARMPGFAVRGEGIAHGLALEHGCPTVSPEPEKQDPEMAKVGMQLVGRNGGFSCISCHGIAKIGPVAAFEAPSINFKHVSDRLRHEYFTRWLRNPARIIPGTKMPAFVDVDGKSPLPNYDSDGAKQFEAIWQYLLSGPDIKHPEQ